jgi:hypothetical protein
MPRIRHELPFFEEPTYVTVPGGRVQVKADQIVVWVGVAERMVPDLPPGTPRFPAVLDIGLSHNFALREEELLTSGSLYSASLRSLGHARLSGLRTDLVDTDVWVYFNKPGSHDEVLDVPPFRLELYTGVAVYPRETAYAPRLPLLGLRGMRRANLQLHIDCRKCRVFLRTPRRFWFFG